MTNGWTVKRVVERTVGLAVLVFVAVGVDEGVWEGTGVAVGDVPFPVTETRRFSAS